MVWIAGPRAAVDAVAGALVGAIPVELGELAVHASAITGMRMAAKARATFTAFSVHRILRRPGILIGPEVRMHQKDADPHLSSKEPREGAAERRGAPDQREGLPRAMS